MLKKITACVLAVMMISGTGALQSANALPETAISASAEKTMDEIMEDPEALLTFTNYTGAMYTVKGKLTKNVTHETEGFFDWRFTFEIDGAELVKALDGDFTRVVDNYEITAKALSDEYKTIRIASSIRTGVINYTSGESVPYYTHGPVSDPIPYVSMSLLLNYINGRFKATNNIVDILSMVDPEGLDSMVIDCWINTSGDVDLEYKPNIQERVGDVNNDGVIDIEDVALIMNHINGIKILDIGATIRADYDSNEVVDIEDAAVIINHINGVKRLK